MIEVVLSLPAFFFSFFVSGLWHPLHTPCMHSSQTAHALQAQQAV